MEEVIEIDGVRYTQEALDKLPDPIVCKRISDIDDRRVVIKQSIHVTGYQIFAPDESKEPGEGWWGK